MHTRRYVNDDEEVIVEDGEHYAVRRSNNWLPLLLIPVFLLLGIWAFYPYRNGVMYQNNNGTSPSNQMPTQGIQYGIGGGPEVSPTSTPGVPPTSTPTPKVSPADDMDVTVSPTTVISP